MSGEQTIQWFPGHMAKTRRQISESLKLVDAVVEIVDARVPQSSRNPEIDKLVSSRPRIMLLNKADIADANATAKWMRYFSSQGFKVIACDCKTGRGLNGFQAAVKEVLAEKIAAWQAKNMKNRTIKLMVVGIPNVGKSSFINRMSKSARAKVADKPGVTRGNQWFTIGGGMELLDTPGVLWPKFDDPVVGERLAFTGAVKDTIIDVETLCNGLLEILRSDYSAMLEGRYGIAPGDMKPYEYLDAVGRKRGMLISGGETDTERAAVMLLDEYRGGKLGRITLERCGG